MRSRLFMVARYAVAALLIYWLTTSGAVDWHALRDRLLTWNLMLIAFAVLLVDIVVTSLRLVVLMRPMGMAMSLADATRLSLVGNLFNLVLQTGGGEAARFYYATAGATGRRTEVAAILVFDRVVGLITLLFMPLLLLAVLRHSLMESPLLRSLILFAAATAAGMVVALALVMWPAAATLIGRVLDRLPYRDHLLRFVEAIRGYRHHPAALVKAFALSVAAHSLAATAIVILHLGGELGPWRDVGAVSLLGAVANSLPLTPGGIGVGEAAFNALFREAGLSGGAEALLSWRVLLLMLVPAGLVIHLRGLRVNLVTEAP